MVNCLAAKTKLSIIAGLMSSIQTLLDILSMQEEDCPNDL